MTQSNISKYAAKFPTFAQRMVATLQCYGMPRKEAEKKTYAIPTKNFSELQKSPSQNTPHRHSTILKKQANLQKSATQNGTKSLSTPLLEELIKQRRADRKKDRFGYYGTFSNS